MSADAERCEAIMRRAGQLLAGLLFALVVLCSPVTSAAAAADGAAVATRGSSAVVAQDSSAQQSGGPQEELTQEQRNMIGVTGLVLIGLVFLSRKIRKKPVFFISWKKK
ncbi:hypothetical protein [Saccharopolyspora rectivirgula]|jgi:hypothetical protein|nr:hypothetical protein [Saccharopolyspora rectivirgula]